MKIRLFSLFFFIFAATAGMNAQILSTRGADKDSNREIFIQVARSYLGTPYVRGGTGTTGMDCSGLVYRAALEGLGLSIPRTVRSISGVSERISDEAIEPGDLLFFNTTGRLSHVAIYLGGGTFVHSASEGPRTGVIISNLSESYWKTTYSFAGRILTPETVNIPDTPEESAPSVNPFPFDGTIGFRLNFTGGMLWDIMPGEYPIRGGMGTAEISWLKNAFAYPGIGAGLSWDSRSKSLSLPVTASLAFPSGFRFFIGTQIHMTAEDSLDSSPQFPGIIGLSWNSKPAEVFGQKLRFYQSAEYSWFPGETFGSGLRFNTGLTLSYDI